MVLIIGILADIPLPQYKKAVEKSRFAETLTNLGIINRAINLYELNNGSLSDGLMLKGLLEATEVELAGGNYKTDTDWYYTTKNFSYFGGTHQMPDEPIDFAIQIVRCPGGTETASYSQCIGNTSYYLETHTDDNRKTCYTEGTDVGRAICAQLKEQGWNIILH